MENQLEHKFPVSKVLWITSSDDKVIKRLEVLGLQITFALDHLAFEIKEASICQNDITIFPRAKPGSFASFLEDTTLTHATEVVFTQTVYKGWITKICLIFKSPVTHKQLL